MSTAREDIAALIPDAEGLKGKVAIPLEFEKISMLAGVSVDDALDGTMSKLREKHEVIPQYRDIKEKTGGMMYGFYINPAVKHQNQIDQALFEVFEEFEKLVEEKNQLLDQINKAKTKLERLEKER